MKEIQGITFDAGGTLLYPYPSVGEIYSEVISAHGLSLSGPVLDQAFRKAWKIAHITPRVGLTIETERNWWRGVVRQTLNGLGEPKNFENLFEDLWQTFAHSDRWRLHQGAIETLKTLRSRGFRLAVLSNWDPRLRAILEGLSLTALFDEIVISSEVGFEKPDERIFQTTQERLGLNPHELLHVGDSQYHDADGASKVGWKWILFTHGSEEEPSEKKISNLLQILDLLKREN